MCWFGSKSCVGLLSGLSDRMYVFWIGFEFVQECFVFLVFGYCWYCFDCIKSMLKFCLFVLVGWGVGFVMVEFLGDV